MTRPTVATVLVLYFVFLIAFASITHALFPPVQSPWVTLTPYEQGTFTAHITGIISTAATAFVISGIIPLAVWAFFRFDAKRARGPLVLWAGLALVLSYLMYVGAIAEFRKSPEAITTSAGRTDFIHGIMDSCTERRRKNPQSAISLMDSDRYCRCFGEKLALLVTADELRGFDGQHEPAPSLRSKIKWARDECVSAAIKSRAQPPRTAGGNPFDQFDDKKDDDEWEDVPAHQ